jgi:tetratricopeptide (TPR) repeat protein
LRAPPFVRIGRAPDEGSNDVMRLMIGLVCAVLTASVALAQNSTTSPAGQQPAAGQPPGDAPPVRYDWQGNHKKAQAALKARDYKTAIILFTEILNSGRLPKGQWTATTYYLRGKAYRESRQYNLAVDDYLAAIAVDPKMDVAWYELGATYQQLNQHAKAVEAFSKAIALKSNNADYHYGRCVSYSWLSNFKSAIGDCEAATRLRPGDADMLGVLGRLYEDSGQKQRAIETYKLALAINPNQPEAKDGLKHLQK